MALDPRLALGVQTPQLTPNLQAGFRLGAAMQDRPEQRREQELKTKGLAREDAEDMAINAYSALGALTPDLVTPESFNSLIQQAQQAGVDIEQEDYTPEGASTLINLTKAGEGLAVRKSAAQRGLAKPSVFKQEEILVDDKGNLFTMVTATDPNNPESTRNIAVAVDGSDIKPEGRLRLTTTEIQTAEEASDVKAKEAFDTKMAEYDAEIKRFDEIAAKEAKAAADMEIAKNDAERSSEALTRADSIGTQIGVLDSAIKAIDEGAQSGKVAQYLPTLRKSTAALEQAAKKMGIETINSATFGALSEKELQLALATEIDTSLDEDVLRDLLEDKKEALQKLQREMRKMGRFLRQGNTYEDWLSLQEREAEATARRQSITQQVSDEELINKWAQ